VSSGDEGRVTIESKSPTNAIDREQQRLAIFEIERPTNDRFGARHIAEGWLQADRDFARAALPLIPRCSCWANGSSHSTRYGGQAFLNPPAFL
jgi:hypothetical protein